MEEFEKESCIRGYQEIWDAVLGVRMSKGTGEPTRPLCLVVVKNATIIGHLPCKISNLLEEVLLLYSGWQSKIFTRLTIGWNGDPMHIALQGSAKRSKELVKLMFCKK